MTTADEAKQRAADAEEHRKIYKGIMKASAEVGVPFCLGLAMFFTQLVLSNGVLVAFISFAGVYLLVWWVVKTFFSH
jgi:Flp pilus assembly protein TadB